MSAWRPLCHLRLGRALPVLMVALGFALAACAAVGPPPAIYVLGDPAALTTVATSEAGLPIVLVRSVELPDYLDTTDLQERRGGEVTASRTGRWGERLSVGATRALAAALASRLPRMAVTVTPPIDRPALQVMVDLEAFGPRADGFVLLVGRWSVVDGAARAALVSERTSFVEPVAAASDAARVAAMTRALDRLAARIATAIASIPLNRARQ